MFELLKEKVCVITGVGKGFGRDLTRVYAENGARLALITRSSEDLAALKEDLKGFNTKGHLFYCGDVSDESTVRDFATRVSDKFETIDVLVNNAGMRFRRPFLEIKPQEFKNVMNNNFFSMVYMCQAFIPLMIKNQSGKIVNLSSIAGTLGLAELSGYISSKAAINGLTKALAIEYAHQNIQVNSIAPGFAKTSYFENFKAKDELYKFTLERTPMGRWGESEEIANVCLFLSSKLSDYITGEVISADGGWSAW